MSLLVLRIGMKGDAVGNWQTFLRGLGFYLGEVDNDFGNATKQATKKFQATNKLNDDGIVGITTYGKAMMLGFNANIVDESTDITSSSYPAKPNFKPLVSREQRDNLFGKFEYKATPSEDNPEKITILGDWKEKHIIQVPLPALEKATGGKYKSMLWHKDCKSQLIKFFEELEQHKLHTRILTYAGAYYPRFVRGSRTSLSNHSWGTAFDINVAYNGLGKQPALVGKKGCVREIVQIANNHGFYWGGHFTRLDGMHFEIAKIMQ
jgi:hypothetical protein